MPQSPQWPHATADHPEPPLQAACLPSTLIEALRTARRAVVLTGAGISAESGIATFRDGLSGLWARFDAAALANEEAFRRDPELVWGWYEWRRMKALQAQPNPGHLAIAAMSRRLPQLTVVTQNVDDLHERAGSDGVLHLHGSLHRPRCLDCDRPYALGDATPDEPEGGRRVPPPRCPECGGRVRPGVVWFGERLPEREWRAAQEAALKCDLLLSIGTSSLVHPAADLPRMAAARGARIVQVNPQATCMDGIASWDLKGAAGTVLPALAAAAWDETVLPS